MTTQQTLDEETKRMVYSWAEYWCKRLHVPGKAGLVAKPSYFIADNVERILWIEVDSSLWNLLSGIDRGDFYELLKREVGDPNNIIIDIVPANAPLRP